MSNDAKRDDAVAQRAKLRRRIQAFYTHFNAKDWDKCFTFIDPRLRDQQRVDLPQYTSSLALFAERYGPITLGHMELSMYLDAKNNKRDDRPFAYGLIVWRDRAHVAHLLRERWICDGESWYTRMVGLVAHEPTTQEEWRQKVEASAGSIPEPTFMRHDQGQYEHRDPLP